MGTRLFAPVQTGPVANPAYCTMGTQSFPGVKWPGYGVEDQFALAPRAELYI